LLVDVPVVSGDAIKNSLASGFPPLIASWLGPTKLITAIIFATITNIVAYLPFLTLPGSTGEFLYSLPIVLTCSLVAALIVAVMFIPFLGYFLLKAKSQLPIEQRRKQGFAAFYYRVGEWGIIIAGRCCSALSSCWPQVDLLPVGSKPTSFQRTFLTFHTLMCGCPKMHRSPPRMKPLDALKKWCATRRRNIARRIPGKMGSRVRFLNHSPLLSVAAGHGSGSRSRLNCRS